MDVANDLRKDKPTMTDILRLAKIFYFLYIVYEVDNEYRNCK